MLNNIPDYIIDAFKEYTDQYGLIQNRIPNTDGSETSGNGLLYTAEALLVLQSYGRLNEFQRTLYTNATESCRLYKGLYCRYKGDTTQEGIDDYIGLGSLSKSLQTGIAGDLLDYGQDHNYKWGPFTAKYYYNNSIYPISVISKTGTNISAWFGRYPQLIAHWHYCNNTSPSFFQKLYWALVIATTGFTKSSAQDTNTWTLSWIMVKNAPDTWYNRLAKKLWSRRLKKNFGSMKSVFAIYFNNPQHPISKYCLD